VRLARDLGQHDRLRVGQLAVGVVDRGGVLDRSVRSDFRRNFGRSVSRSFSRKRPQTWAGSAGSWASGAPAGVGFASSPAGSLGAGALGTRRSPLLVRLISGKTTCGRRGGCAAPIEPVTSLAPRLASRTMGDSGIVVPTGRGRLKVAAWIVPNGEAIRCSRQRAATAGCCAISAAIS
jgi:hypothetical protein